MTEMYQQPKRKSVHLINDINGLSRDSIVLTGGDFVSGEVVGELADGRFTKLDLTLNATEAHEARAIVFGDYEATTADLTAQAHSRLAAVRADRLVWPDAATTEQKAAFLAQLSAAHIVAR